MTNLPMRVPVTASWSSQLPNGYAAIGISRGAPRGRRGYRMYRPLAPGPWFKSVDAEEFLALYMAQLGALDPHQVLRDLAQLADGKIPALLCFEKPPPAAAWCHRGLVAGWLHETAGMDVRELAFEHVGAGWAHPKLPASLRRR